MRDVLIVDDDDDIRLLLRALFEQRGWQVDEAANGEDGVALTQERSYDAMVVDHSMPGMTGAEVVARVRGDRFAGPIIFYSAYHTSELERALQDVGNGQIHIVAKTDFGRLVSVIGELSA